MKTLLILVLTLALLIILFVLWASMAGPHSKERRDLVVNISGDAPALVDEVKVLSWNIAWGYGMGSEGVGYEPKSKEAFIKNLDEMASVIERSQADIVLLQEVDFASDKSHGIDQLEYLANKLKMNRAYALSWDHNYLPFPYWPPSKHFGKVSSGGGILSRFPISENEVVLWKKPEANPWWYNLFYLYRYSQIAQLNINGEKRTVVNSHLEAFDLTNRSEQAKRLKELLAPEKELFIVGGDFNTVPPVAKVKSAFAQDSKEYFEDDPTYEIIASVPGLKDTLSIEEYEKDENKWFTFSTEKPVMKLDYIFVSESVEAKGFEIIQTPASDHFPIRVELKL